MAMFFCSLAVTIAIPPLAATSQYINRQSVQRSASCIVSGDADSCRFLF